MGSIREGPEMDWYELVRSRATVARTFVGEVDWAFMHVRQAVQCCSRQVGEQRYMHPECVSAGHLSREGNAGVAVI